MNKDLNVAIVGCGKISDDHITSWKDVGAKIVAICDKDVSIAKNKSDLWKIPHYYQDVVKMVNEENLDVASICTPPQVRSIVTDPLMENGVHVLIEKPFAISVTEAEKMITKQYKTGVKLSVVHNWLFTYAMQKTMKIINYNELGEILSVDICLLNTPKDEMASSPSHWCHSMKGGRFGEMIIHPLYLLQAILGNLNIRHTLGTKIGDYYWMEIDELHVLLENDYGKQGRIYASFNSPRRDSTLRIIGSKKILEVDLSNHTIIKKDPRRIVKRQVIWDNIKVLSNFIKSTFSISFAILTNKYPGMLTLLIQQFKKSIINDTVPPVTGEEALQVTKTYEKLCSLLP